LQNNDLIEIGKYKLKYVSSQTAQANTDDFEKTMILRAPVRQAAPMVEKSDVAASFMKTQVNANATPPSDASERTGKFDAHPPVTPAATAAPASTPQAAAVQILTGPNTGKELALVKNLTTLGKPGVQVAVLTRRPHGFFITHVEGANHPMVNGITLGDQPHQLNDHDVIELAGVKMEFYFKG